MEIKMKVLVIGYGLLGKEIVKQTGWDYISRSKDGVDFTEPWTYESCLRGYDCIINCVANTDTYSNNKESHWNVNYRGVNDLVSICNKLGKKLVHISTDYVYANSQKNASEEDVPVHCPTWYGYTKLLGDGCVQLNSNDYLLIRCTHKPTPFPYKKAFVNLIGNFDYVNQITEIIVKLVEANAVGVYNVGTEMKSIYQMARETSEDVEPVNAVCDPNMPSDVSMDITKLKDFLSWK